MIRWLVCGLLLLCSANLHAAQQIKVGVYDFAPFAFVDDEVTGVTAQMIAAMNQFQQQYEFVMVPTTAKRRYKDFADKKFDMLIFESKSWGWLEYPVASSLAFLKGAEVYISLAGKGRDQGFFGDFKNKSLVGVLGYHYGFARFHAERDYLEKNFDIVLTDSQKTCLALLLKGRGEIAIISQDYLNYHFKNQPQDKAKILISETKDQVYRHTILLRKGMDGINIRNINQLIAQMKRKGALEPLWNEYGLGN